MIARWWQRMALVGKWALTCGDALERHGSRDYSLKFLRTLCGLGQAGETVRTVDCIPA